MEDFIRNILIPFQSVLCVNLGFFYRIILREVCLSLRNKVFIDIIIFIFKDRVVKYVFFEVLLSS